MTDNAVASANIRMETNAAGLTTKTYSNPIRLMAPNGMESALGLSGSTEYAVQAVPVPDGFRMVTQDEMESCKKDGAVVRFWSTKSEPQGAWKKIKDKESTTWDNNLYVVPCGTVLKKDLSITVNVNGTDIELSDDQAQAIADAVNA